MRKSQQQLRCIYNAYQYGWQVESVYKHLCVIVIPKSWDWQENEKDVEGGEGRGHAKVTSGRGGDREKGKRWMLCPLLTLAFKQAASRSLACPNFL